MLRTYLGPDSPLLFSPVAMTAQQESDLLGVMVTAARIITVESTGSADVYPFAKARAGLAANFFLRNDTDSVKTVNILITIGGTVENVARERGHRRE